MKSAFIASAMIFGLTSVAVADSGVSPAGTHYRQVVNDSFEHAGMPISTPSANRSSRDRTTSGDYRAKVRRSFERAGMIGGAKIGDCPKTPTCTQSSHPAR